MPLPATTGLGFKPQHFQDIRATRPDLGFFEVHAENYLGAGGAPHAMLTALRQDYAISIHGVGLSIGGPQLDLAHLSRIKALCDRYDPDSFSEHLAWSSHGTEYLNDLLPLPYTPDTLDRVCDHVDRVQEVLGRRLLLENPSTYVIFAQSEIPETDFLAQIARRTGCGLLLDVNNVFVSCVNHRSDPLAWLDAFPLDLVGEIHLGGHDQEDLPSGPLLIDAHGAEVAEPVWALYAEVLDRAGPLPTLVEWDNDVPEWHVLMAEAQRAATLLADRRQHAAAQ
jgi:uncharacterized protein